MRKNANRGCIPYQTDTKREWYHISYHSFSRTYCNSLITPAPPIRMYAATPMPYHSAKFIAVSPSEWLQGLTLLRR